MSASSATARARAPSDGAGARAEAKVNRARGPCAMPLTFPLPLTLHGKCPRVLTLQDIWQAISTVKSARSMREAIASVDAVMDCYLELCLPRAQAHVTAHIVKSFSNVLSIVALYRMLRSKLCTASCVPQAVYRMLCTASCLQQAVYRKLFMFTANCVQRALLLLSCVQPA